MDDYERRIWHSSAAGPDTVPASRRRLPANPEAIPSEPILVSYKEVQT